ncbi:MAG: hypothetical protein K8R90_03340 [Candidatus Cloacimonetes bacterium]|nr:hypothetical protein [Candidatus Cloacimonadota bacterium]
MKRAIESWANFLNPEILRKNLIALSIFVNGYEVFKASVIDRILEFYITGFDKRAKRHTEDSSFDMFSASMRDSYMKGDWIISNKYKTEVLSKSKKGKIDASLKWLQENDVISGDDYATCEEAHKLRNNIAHFMLDYISDPMRAPEVLKVYRKLVDLLHKIDKWFFDSELPLLADDINFDNADIEGSFSMTILILNLMAEIALNPDSSESSQYYEEFIKMAGLDKSEER